jgi:predicted GTPase
MGDRRYSQFSSVHENRKALTVILMGKVGAGKSGLGNSILGEKRFLSKPSTVGVTCTSELHSTVSEDGQILNVIDTPGLLDYSRKPEFLRKEVLNCMELAKDGLHAVLLVISVKARYSAEEKKSVDQLLESFGRKISDYMIIVFTGGDDLNEIGETFDAYLDSCPDELKEILETCGNRRVLFDNKTKDIVKKSEQLKLLLSLVNEVTKTNNGKPYTNELIAELKNEEAMLCEQTDVKTMKDYTEQGTSEYKEQIAKSQQMMDSTLKEGDKLELEIFKEKNARLQAELSTLSTQSALFQEELEKEKNKKNKKKIFGLVNVFW